MPDPQDVCEVMACMLPAPDTALTDEFYFREVFPIKILYNIDELYGFTEIDGHFLIKIPLREYEFSRKDIMNII